MHPVMREQFATLKGPLFDILVHASALVAPDAIPTLSLSPGKTVRFFRARPSPASTG